MNVSGYVPCLKNTLDAIVTQNYIILNNLFVFDRNTWNHSMMCKQMIIDK